MITIYHNPRCSKSREVLKILESREQPLEIIKYMDSPLNADELSELLNKLEMRPEELLRKNEPIWKEKYKGKELSDDQVIEAMIANPKLIERPIVVKDQAAVLGRPPENVLELI